MNKKLILLLLIVLFCLLGCSNTTVHLHAYGLPEEERDTLRLGLENRGFLVELRDNESPSSGNLVLYARRSGIENDLRSIDEVLENSGLKAEHRHVTRTNKLGMHEYTPGNIGIYIISGSSQGHSSITSRVREIFPLSMTNAEFVSMDCEQDYLYEFEEDGSLVISQLAVPDEEVEAKTWRWQSQSDNSVIIFDGIEQFEFKKIESHSEHPGRYSFHVVTYNILLEPLDYYRIPFGCKYKSTFREAY